MVFFPTILLYGWKSFERILNTWFYSAQRSNRLWTSTCKTLTLCDLFRRYVADNLWIVLFNVRIFSPCDRYFCLYVISAPEKLWRTILVRICSLFQWIVRWSKLTITISDSIFHNHIYIYKSLLIKRLMMLIGNTMKDLNET